MRVLVLGGTGLISTPIVEQLIKSEHEPVIINRGQTPSRLSADVETVHVDRNDFEAFETAVEEIAPDAVIDMLTFDSHTAEHAVATFKDSSIKQYLFCSATSVYGPLTHLPADEAEPHNPSGQYGQHKSEAERIFMDAVETHQFPVTILRPAHVYGPGQTLPSLWGYDACLVSRIRTDKGILVPGDGFGAFQLNYADDVAAAFVQALGVAETLGQIYNIAPEEHLDWRGYITAIGASVDKEVQLIPVPTNLLIAGSPPDATSLLEDIYQYPMSYSSALFRSHVPNWTASTSLSDGLSRTIDWMNQANAHINPDEQSWIDPLVNKVLDFEKDLALSNFAMDEKLFTEE